MRSIAPFRKAYYAGLLPLLGAAIAATAYFQDDRAWRFEMARATDRCGLYLYLFGPLLSGIAAFETWTHRRRFADLVDPLPQPRSAAVRPFLLVTGMAVSLHVVVVIVYLVTAASAGAFGPVPIGLLVVQFASIPGYVAAGVLVGWWSRTPLAAPACAAVIILLNVEGPITQQKWREITTVGLGGGDIIGTRVSLHHALAQIAVFLGLALVVWVGPRSRVWQVRTFFVVGLGVAVAAGWNVSHMNDQRLVFDSSVLPYVCKGDKPAMCGPREAAATYPGIATVLAQVAAPLYEVGVTQVPAQFSLNYPGSPQPPRGTGLVALSSEHLRDAIAIRAAAVVGLTNPSTCDDLSPYAPPPPMNVIIIRAMVTGWLAERSHVALPGQYPSDLVAALDHLPLQVQQRWLTGTFRYMWACNNKALALPPGVPLPAYLSQQ